MNGPACESTTTVVLDNDRRRKGAQIKRRRMCALCGTEFSTVELLASSLNRLRELLRARREIDKIIEEIAGASWFEPTETPERSPAPFRAFDGHAK